MLSWNAVSVFLADDDDEEIGGIDRVTVKSFMEGFGEDDDDEESLDEDELDADESSADDMTYKDYGQAASGVKNNLKS